LLALSGALGTLLCFLINVATIVLLLKVIFSWVMAMSGAPISGPFRTVIEIVDDVTNPILRPLQRLIPPVRAGGMGLDLSPMLAFVILIVLRQVIGC
jgi:YggT family protein